MSGSKILDFNSDVFNFFRQTFPQKIEADLIFHGLAARWFSKAHPVCDNIFSYSIEFVSEVSVSSAFYYE